MATFDSTGGRKLKPTPRQTVARRPAVKVKAKPKRAPTTKPPVVDPLDAQVLVATAMQYGGADQALAGQRRVHQHMMANTSPMFAEYQAALARATAATGAAYGGAAQIQQNATSSTSALDAQQRAALGGQMATDAAARGATVDPRIAAEGQQASMARRATADAATGLTAQLGAGQVGYRAGQQVVGAGQKLNALQAEAQRGRDIERQQLDLGREAGAYAVAAKQKLLDTAHTQRLEEAAFGLDVKKAEQDAALGAARIRETRRARVTSNRNTDQSRGIAAQRAAEQARANRVREQQAEVRLRATGGAKRDKVKQREVAKIRNNINTAAADARTLRNAPVPIEDPKTGKPTGKTRKATESEIRANIRKRYKDADIANAAMDLAILGHVSPTNQRRLKARGIRLPSSWIPKRKPKALGELVGGKDRVSSRPPIPGLK
ncbi:MAG TPA: hypothetical protein VE645_19170 [Pseudonocardiaceae bacterium]|jgi:hypothetical protein|nr:hypothetical protein [Pseudonocardiaceae bacterium]